MAGDPYWKLYTGEWMKDECLSVCEPATRGIFVDWLCSMHNGLVDRLTGTPRQLARLGRCNDAEALAALRDLQITRTVEVSERDGFWTLVSRRRRRELNTSEKRREAGSKGLAKRWQSPDIDSESENGFERRLGNLFRRREGTPWSDKEKLAYLKLPLVAEEDLAAVERYYAEQMPKDKDYRRRDLLTLLNNWNGEVDRAKARLPRHRRKVVYHRAEPPPSPETIAKQEAFVKRLEEWKAKGRPLGEFPAAP